MSDTTETHLSREAFDRLQAEFDDLTTRGRVEVAHRIEAARALGDLSENGDYHAAKDDQGKMEARIRKIQALLKNAKIVEGHEGDVISIGAIVSIRYEGDDDVERFLVGSIEEQRDDVQVVSPGSKLGEALLGKKPGDTVEYETPTGAKLKVAIIEVGALPFRTPSALPTELVRSTGVMSRWIS
jgi:transcription elongation factor GreA